MIYAILSDDMIAGRMSGSAMDGVAIPSILASLPDERLRFVSGEIVDAATITEWHIDDLGRKRVQPAEDRQPLTCSWDAALVMDGGSWRVVTSDDARAKSLSAECSAKIKDLLDQETQSNLNGLANKLNRKSISGSLTADEAADLDAAEAAYDWTQAMIAECRRAISEGADANWPDPSVAVKNIASRY